MGLRLSPQLKDPAAARPRPMVTTWGHAHAVRSHGWRYIRYEDGGEELYDHRRDPGEWNNLAGDPQYADVKAEHLDWLHKIITVER